MEENILDPAFMPIFMHIIELADFQECSFVDERAGFRLELDEMTAEMPVEMDIVLDETGLVHLGSSPPIYYANTSVQPVYHNLRITIKGEKKDCNGNTKQTLEP